MSPIFLSVVIPAYNEGGNLSATIEELSQTLGRSPLVRDWEIVVVDDHSTDGTLDAVKAVSSPRVRGVRLSRRSGSHTAIRAGLDECRGEAALCLAADGQEDQQVLDRMLAKIASGTHVVWGVRRARNESFFERLSAAAAYAVITAFSDRGGTSIDIANANFFVLSREVIDAVASCPERNTSLLGLVLWLGFRQDFVPYERRARRAGRSKWSLRSRARLFKDWVIAFSGAPLKLISWIGLATAALGFLYAAFILAYSILGFAKPGWAETVILILVLGGTQMLMLGIVGEYLWRTLDETRRRPLYFVEERTEASLCEQPGAGPR